MKNIFISHLAVIMLVLLVPAAACLGHGTSCRMIANVPAVEAFFDDGRPMAYCDVTVFFGAAEDSVFTTGETDEIGRYSFFPDSGGEYRVVVDDGMGHAASIMVTAGDGPISVKGLEDDGAAGGDDESGACIFRRIGRGEGLLVGVSVIFGLFGLVCLLRSGK